MRGRHLWCKGEDGLRIYKATTATINVDGDEAYGEFDPNENSITIASMEEIMMRKKLLHELGHKIFQAIPGSVRVDIFGEILDEYEYDLKEEALCAWLEDRGYQVLKPWLKFPKSPK